MFEGSKTPLNIFVEIWILQILMSFKLNFWYQQTVYILMAWNPFNYADYLVVDDTELSLRHYILHEMPHYVH